MTAVAERRTRTTQQTIRLFLLLEGASFIVAALTHAGVLIGGYEDTAAAIAETVIAVVLLLGAAVTWVSAGRTRPIGLVAQGFAFAGTLIGTYVSAIGIGPSTMPDRVYHVGMLVALVWGLIVCLRDPSRQGGSARLTAVTILQVLTRATGLLQIALGLAFWTGTLLVAVPFHMFNGILFVLLLEMQAGLAAWAGASMRLVTVAAAWGLFVVLFGITQVSILPGDWHWVFRVAHLAVGLVAIGLAERLAGAAKGQLGARTPSSRTSV
jgi:hypothetical protein